MEIHNGEIAGSGMNGHGGEGGAGATGNVTNTQGGEDIDDLLEPGDLQVSKSPSPTASPGDDPIEAIDISDLKKAQDDLKRGQDEYAKYQKMYEERKAREKEIKQQKKEALDRGDKSEVDRLREEQIRNDQFKDSARSNANDALHCVEKIREHVDHLQKPHGTK